MKFNTDYPSPSKYANFADCPMKFWIFNDKLNPHAKEYKTVNKSIGNVVNRSIDLFLKRPVDNRTEESLKADFDLSWLKEKHDHPGEWSILESEEETAKEDSWLMLTSFLKGFDYKLTPLYFPPSLDVPNSFDLLLKYKLKPDLIICGVGDRLDDLGNGEFEVIDYKTKNGVELIEEKNNLQLRMYGLLFDQWLKDTDRLGKVTKISFLYLTPHGVEKREHGFTEEDRQKTIAEVQNIQTQIRKLWEEYQTNQWPCKGDHCDILLRKMEARADEWARGMSAAPIQQTLTPIQDIPF